MAACARAGQYIGHTVHQRNYGADGKCNHGADDQRNRRIVRIYDDGTVRRYTDRGDGRYDDGAVGNYADGTVRRQHVLDIDASTLRWQHAACL